GGGKPPHPEGGKPLHSEGFSGTSFGIPTSMSPDAAKVLIIEDDDALRVMLFTILRHQPLGVDTAANADDAMAKVRECDYALILIDLNLPDDQSGQFLRRFRQERPQAPTFIIAVRDP